MTGCRFLHAVFEDDHKCVTFPGRENIMLKPNRVAGFIFAAPGIRENCSTAGSLQNYPMAKGKNGYSVSVMNWNLTVRFCISAFYRFSGRLKNEGSQFCVTGKKYVKNRTGKI